MRGTPVRGDLGDGWRDWRAMQAGFRNFDDVDAASGWRLDRLLAVQNVVDEVRAEKTNG